MQQPQPPKIEFPCANYPIKVVGEQGDSFKDDVFAVLDGMGIVHSTTRIREMPSKNDRFVALTIPITAESEQQLSDLNVALRQLSSVKMVI